MQHTPSSAESRVHPLRWVSSQRRETHRNAQSARKAPRTHLSCLELLFSLFQILTCMPSAVTLFIGNTSRGVDCECSNHTMHQQRRGGGRSQNRPMPVQGKASLTTTWFLMRGRPLRFTPCFRPSAPRVPTTCPWISLAMPQQTRHRSTRVGAVHTVAHPCSCCAMASTFCPKSS